MNISSSVRLLIWQHLQWWYLFINATVNRKVIKNFANGKFGNFFTFAHWPFEESQDYMDSTVPAAARPYQLLSFRLTPFSRIMTYNRRFKNILWFITIPLLYRTDMFFFSLLWTISFKCWVMTSAGLHSTS